MIRGGTTAQATAPGSSVYFQNCYLIVNKVVTTKRKNEVYPIQYHNHWWTVDAQDIHDRKWYSCSYTRDVPDDLNAQRPTCTDCVRK
ncbi:hypothetical protein H4Q26_001838 [Puccinia striiformis f. sp. tritici PST-130]|nr:hypothetical protein H4Q26_001838 [Puccinia striiformis f. sp. tritici PST-130]